MQDHQNDADSEVSFCPSFNSYSSAQVAETAARVRREEDGHSTAAHQSEDKDDDFEFVLMGGNPEDDDSVNGNGEFFPGFPVFNRDLLLDHYYEQDQRQRRQHQQQRADFDGEAASPIRFSLEKLFIDDRDPQSSSSSSEVDELEGVPPGTYCVWTPKLTSSASPSPGRCKKSNSTGSSSSSSSKPRLGWRLRDLLRRSRSDGEKTLVFLNQNSSNNSHEGKLGKRKEEEKGEKGKSIIPVKAKAKEKPSAHEVFYVKSKALKEGDKRKSYLPYRQDLVGFFANVNGLGRTFPPF